METIKIGDSEYKVIKTLKSDDKVYLYTLDINNDNEVVIISLIDNVYHIVDEREYSILMNKFALK